MHAKALPGVNGTEDRIAAQRQAESDVLIVHRPVAILVVEIVDGERAQLDLLDGRVADYAAIALEKGIVVAGIVVRVAERAVRVEVRHDVSVDADEADEAQAVARGDAGDLVEIDGAVVVEVRREDEAIPFLDVEQVGAGIFRGRAEPLSCVQDGGPADDRGNKLGSGDHARRRDAGFEDLETVFGGGVGGHSWGKRLGVR